MSKSDSKSGNKKSSLMDEYEYEKYIATPDNVMDIINQYGVAIIPSLLNDEECEKMATGMWDTLEDIKVLHGCGFRILFFSSQWLSWYQRGTL